MIHKLVVLLAEAVIESAGVTVIVTGVRALSQPLTPTSDTKNVVVVLIIVVKVLDVPTWAVVAPVADVYHLKVPFPFAPEVLVTLAAGIFVPQCALLVAVGADGKGKTVTTAFWELIKHPCALAAVTLILWGPTEPV